MNVPSATVLESSAASAVGTDLLDGKKIQSSRRPRAVRFIGLVGSTAVADAAIDLFYGDKYVGTFYNTTAGAAKVPLANQDLIPVGRGLMCPPGVDLHAFITDAGTGNVLALTVVADEY
jgi:hypothetical protein